MSEKSSIALRSPVFLESIGLYTDIAHRRTAMTWLADQ